MTTTAASPRIRLGAKAFGVLAVVGLVVAFSLSSTLLGVEVTDPDAVSPAHGIPSPLRYAARSLKESDSEGNLRARPSSERPLPA